jgi:signal transduction histidine kinase
MDAMSYPPAGWRPAEPTGYWSDDPPPAPARRRASLLPWSGRAWREYGYLWLQFLLGPLALTYVLLVPSLAGGLLVTVVGLFAAGGLVLGARGWGAAYRGLGRAILASPVPAPPGWVRPRGFWRTLAAMLFDSTGWRALLYMFLSFPLGLMGWIFSTTWLATGLGGLTYWFWEQFLPAQTGPNGVEHRGVVFGTWYADTPARQGLVALIGLVFAFTWAPITRGFAQLFALLGRGLLGPTAGSIRVAELRRQRASMVTDADSRLRRIERALHDGTQNRLVSVAMQLGEAREALPTDPGAAATYLDAAHAQVKDTLTELREIVRGIHPPTLDSGIGVALAGLAARTPLPVRVEAAPDIDALPLAPAISSLAYYAVAELLTNVVKHAGATRAEIALRRAVDERGAARLWISVSDDGRGGAVVLPGEAGLSGTGLRGIAERVGAVDGAMRVSSPVGGGTVVDIALPVAVR